MERHDFVENVAAKEPRPLGRSIKRGILNTCPACGSARLFRAFLKPVDICPACGEELFHERSDDLPPYLVIVVVGHVLMTAYMLTDAMMPDALWVHLVVWVSLAILTSLLTIQPIKGGVIGLQWALRMHGFGDTPDPIEENRKPGK
ncbi:DUF983 domain-containing protein [Rhizobium sp. L1K21]|uniref:DUF983 domain-containing protein n=1 Tax=Rhizobium sp. L1K21 TaxID=2954933 RepID=UPI002093ADB1|nr:DUF983 domain-containing protein [Rhizobium sp. L1K21]MCO6186023.1 DUF983 domain-containing protein [Rhizobium sp. L1K21]